MTEESMMPRCTVSVAESREVIATASSDDKHEARSSSSKMADAVPITTPMRAFQENLHEGIIQAIAISPHRQCMVTGSGPTLRLWDLKDFTVLKEMEGHCSDVRAVAVSRDGQLIVSSDQEGKFIAWREKTGKSFTKVDAHSNSICSLDFSPDGTMMASGSFDRTTKLWNTKTWQVEGEPIQCSNLVCCVRYSPSGELLAIATDLGISIYDPSTRERVTNFKIHTASNFSLAWKSDGTRLLSAGGDTDPTIREWNASTWKQVSDPWTGHTKGITAIAVNSAGTMVASASRDNHVRLWRLSDRRTIAIFNHSDSVNCVTFSTNGRHIISGGDDKKVSEWAVDIRGAAKVTRALLIAVMNTTRQTLLLAHKDVVRMRDFLVDSRGYQPENIVLMMDHQSVVPNLYPTRKNIVRQIDIMLQRTSEHDHIFFYYSGCGDRVTREREVGNDNQNSAIFDCKGMTINSNFLKKHLVDPLPQNTNLFSLWDCGHSQTMLELEHCECNELWRVPFKVMSGLGRKTESPGKRLSASLSMIDNVDPGSRAPSPDSSLCTPDCLLTLPEEQVKAHVVSLSACRDNELAYDDSETGDTVTKFFIDYFERNPEASYHDLLSYIWHKVDELTLRRTQIERAGETSHDVQELSENEVENEDELSQHRDHSNAENATVTLKSQRPSYSSRYRLDMLQIVDL